MEDQRDKVGGLAAFDDDSGLERLRRVLTCRIAREMFGEVEGWEACKLITDGEEEDERDNGSDAHDA